MGGNFQGIGNVTSSAEFNFFSDAEAAKIVLSESKCPVYIFPWETCLKASKATPLHEWRLKVLSNNSDVTNFMDPVDAKIKIKGNFIPCDAYTTACFMVPEMIKEMENCHVTVELAGNHTKGQMIIDRKGIEEKNAFVIQEIDAEMFKKFFLRICGHENSDL